MPDDVPQSRLMWMLHSLGFQFAVGIPLTALLAAGVVLLLFQRGRGPAMVGAVLLVVPLPIYVALLGILSGVIRTCGIVSLTDTPLKQSDIAEVLADALICLSFALTVTLPVLLMAVAGLMIKALRPETVAEGRLTPL